MNSFGSADLSVFTVALCSLKRGHRIHPRGLHAGGQAGVGFSTRKEPAEFLSSWQAAMQLNFLHMQRVELGGGLEAWRYPGEPLSALLVNLLSSALRLSSFPLASS